ncbi:putative C-mannosyltransferase DPY19L3, partial [Scleropages formosus]
RKSVKGKDPGLESRKPEAPEDPSTRTPAGDWTWWMVPWTAAGATVAVALGLLSCIYVATLHENDLWFSNIKEVEREISFRTECGLYYSYYKQMLRAPSIQEGLLQLIQDNVTESKRTINILQRMNIYQEVFLSILYRLLPVQEYLEPIYFYIYTVFALQAVYVIALYITSWLLSDSWLAGALAAVWYIINRVDTTRVASITYYLRPQLKPLPQKVALWLTFLSTLWFCLTWQFNQFILLIQALVVFALDCLDFIEPRKVTLLYLVQTKLKTGGLMVRMGKLCVHVLLVLVMTFTINYLTKKVLQLSSDEHIYKFIKAKLGLGLTRDFDAKLYLCEEAFGLLPLDTFERLTTTLVLYPYLCALAILLVVLVAISLVHLSGSGCSGAQSEGVEHRIHMRPDVAYNLLHTVLFGLLALSTMRMKYLWTGHMCMFAAYGVCGRELWGICLGALRCNTQTKLRIVRYAAPSLLLAFLYFKFWPKIKEEVSELREFYDPDTVELMTWI